MLHLVKYKGDHVGRTVMAVKCSNAEIIPLICDSPEEEIEYQKLCQLDIHDVRGQNSPLSRPCIKPPGAIFGIAEPPLGWPWFVVCASPFPVNGYQRGYWTFDIADNREDAVRELNEILESAGLDQTYTQDEVIRRGYWKFNIADNRENTVRELNEIPKSAGLDQAYTQDQVIRSPEMSKSRWIFHRARGDFDGGFPVYALFGKQKVPLTADQCKELNQQALRLARRPNTEIKSTIQEMLDADNSGNEHLLEIAGFLRAMRPYNGSRRKILTNAPSDCDQCGRDLGEVGFFLDACTIEDMKWSWMCPPCFFALGCGVGYGFGQLYLREGNETFLILGQ
jgi:hypothetical protein